LLETTTSIFARAHEPFFVFVNLADAHLPRSPAPEHVERFVDPALADAPVLANERAYTIGDAEMTDRGFRRLCQLYDADVRTADDRFGAFLDLLDTSGVLADTLVVAVSDHGEHLGEFGRVGHQFSVFDSVISVPLAVQFPHEEPGCVDEQVEIRRLFHTILDETGIQSFPERTLASGNGDAVARGSYHSPMVDIASLCSDGRVRYKDELLGEPLSFARTPEAKLLDFNGEEWLFGVPERCRSPLEIARAPETREKLSRQLPGQS
jgi:arylsulfatase A-like enzyme